MSSPAFDYLRVSSADEAALLLVNQGDDPRRLAGGHPLVTGVTVSEDESVFLQRSGEAVGEHGWSRRGFLLGAGAAAAGLTGWAWPLRPALAAPDGRGVGAVRASQGSGVTRTGLGRGVVTRGASMEVTPGSEVVADWVTILPGGTTGWHSHPGPEIVIVTHGRLTFRRTDGRRCFTETVAAGQASVGAAAGEVHAAHNEGPEPVRFVVAFFNVPQAGQARTEADPPAACP